MLIKQGGKSVSLFGPTYLWNLLKITTLLVYLALLVYLVPESTVYNFDHFLTPPSLLIADVVYGWALKYLFIDRKTKVYLHGKVYLEACLTLFLSNWKTNLFDKRAKQIFKYIWNILNYIVHLPVCTHCAVMHTPGFIARKRKRT